MKFMNKKEDVIDFQLTQYGKRLLSQGKLKPVYYSFFDDNILYDSRYLTSSIVENQNDIEDRIQNLTLQLETQYNFQGLETRYEAQLEELGPISAPFLAADEVERATFSSNLDRLYYYNKPLGTTNLNSTKTPSFQIDFYSLEKMNIDQQLTKPTRQRGPLALHPTGSKISIPQIDLKITNKILKGGALPEVLDTQTLLAEFLETNVNFDRENFEIEVFKKKDESPTSDYMPLLFKKDASKSLIRDGILIDPNPNETTVEIDENYVEYYFKINVDSEIPNAEILKYVGQEKVKNILTDDPSREIDYNAEGINSISIYSDFDSLEDNCDEE